MKIMIIIFYSYQFLLLLFSNFSYFFLLFDYDFDVILHMFLIHIDIKCIFFIEELKNELILILLSSSQVKKIFSLILLPSTLFGRWIFLITYITHVWYFCWVHDHDEHHCNKTLVIPSWEIIKRKRLRNLQIKNIWISFIQCREFHWTAATTNTYHEQQNIRTFNKWK